MVKRTGSSRRKSKRKLIKPLRKRGKLSIAKYLAKFSKGDRVVLKAEPSVQTGMYAVRFHGKVGTVDGKQGSCYHVLIKDGSKQKDLIVHPVHLNKH